MHGHGQQGCPLPLFLSQHGNGKLFESDIVIGFTTALNADTGFGSVGYRAFEAAYVGQGAEGDVKLRDLDKSGCQRTFPSGGPRG